MTSLATVPVGALHVAYLDHMTGVGMLVCPSSNADVFLGSESVNEADGNVAMRQLHALGWEPLADEYDLPMEEGATADGRPVFALYGREPIISHPTFPEIAAANAALAALVGVQ